MEHLRVKEILAEKGMTSKELAEKTEVSQNTISNINKGIHFPNKDLLFKIAEVLEVDVKDLFNSTLDIEEKGKPIFIEENGKFIKIGELKI